MYKYRFNVHIGPFFFCFSFTSISPLYSLSRHYQSKLFAKFVFFCFAFFLSLDVGFFFFLIVFLPFRIGFLVPPLFYFIFDRRFSFYSTLLLANVFFSLVQKLTTSISFLIFFSLLAFSVQTVGTYITLCIMYVIYTLLVLLVLDVHSNRGTYCSAGIL